MTAPAPDSAPLSTLMDDFAMNAMAQMIHVYALEDTSKKKEFCEWCENIASMSYIMAASMMDKRIALHQEIINKFQEEPDEA